MSFQEKRALVSGVSTILINVLYAREMSARYPTSGDYSPEVFQFWGMYLLLLIGVTIVAYIIIHIIFVILNTIATREEEPNIVDERDKLIDLKATRNSLYVFQIGFLLAMVALVAGAAPSLMFVILIGAGVVSSLVSDISQFYFYRRGY